jgi:hypothetical protein
MIRRLRAGQDGIGIVTALIVAFIIFSFGAVWYSVSVHELDETVYDRHRTTALHVADAGVRRAMYELSRTALAGAPFWTGNGTDGSGYCAIDTVTTDAGAETLGQYWVEVTDATPANAVDHRYFIESWGWSRDLDSRQATMRKLQQEVEIVIRRGFVYALFAASGGVAAGQKKVIYGDVYSQADVAFANSTEVLANDAGYPGTGNLYGAGGLTVPNGASVHIQGTVSMNTFIDVQDPSFDVDTDVIVTQGSAFIENGDVSGSINLGGTLLPGSGVTYGSLGETLTLEPNDVQSLPDFDWSVIVATYGAPSAGGPVYWHDSWADFSNYFSINRGALSGWHYVADTGAYTLKLGTGGGATFADDFMLVHEGTLTVEGGADVNPAETPITVSLIGTNPAGAVWVGKNLKSNEDLRYLVFSKGEVGAKNLSIVYGVIYGETDGSSNQLTVHYRPPNNDLGFIFSYDKHAVAQPYVWREVQDDPLPCPTPP